MRLAIIFGIFFFITGALAAERYGLPDPVTRYTDQGFAKVEGWLGIAPDNAAGRSAEAGSASGGEMARSRAGAQAATGQASLPANADLDLNADGLEIIKTSRGLTLSATEKYGRWQIGYGHTGEEEGEIADGMTVTVPKAEALLLEDLVPVETALKQTVGVPLNENEYSALVSFADSMGMENFVQTDVYQELQAGRRGAAADAMLQHTTALIDGEPEQMPSLLERRVRERQLFLRRP